MSNTDNQYTNVFSIRVTEEMQDMLSYLQTRKFLNKTAVIRTAITEEYRREKLKEYLSDWNLYKENVDKVLYGGDIHE